MRAPAAAALGVASVIAGLAACDGDTLRIALQISAGPVQACPSSAVPAAPACGDVPMLCDAVLDVRIVRPSSPDEAYLSSCTLIPRDRKRDLCSIEHINLPAGQLPKETLEVQVMIWPREAVKEADPSTGELDCREIYGRPVSVGFGVHGFPEEAVPSPALGGRAFYHPGDDLTVVTLGCSDLAAVNRPSCAGQIEIRAGVTELDAPLQSVTPVVAAELLVSVGEPRYVANRDHHEWSPLKALDLEAGAPPGPADPRWGEAVEVLAIEDSLCVQVIGGQGANTATVRCGRIDPVERKLELTGTWLPRPRLAQILAGLGLTEPPAQGMTIGVLLDEKGALAAGYQIRTSPDSLVQYLTPTSQVVPGGTATTSAGLFVSMDAPYGADFRASQGEQLPSALGIGGRVHGKVTIVVLQLAGGASG
ncbi:MAG TPA: hypothetical protein VK932_18570 [Kofleriaceae bacterium]|nr:hypothetical protein [Kofleriaceae bacterium]